MNRKECRVRARSLEAALHEVKEKYGKDALILRTRELKKRKRGGLGYETLYEISVAPEKEIRPGEPPLVDTSDAGQSVTGNAEKIRKQIARLEKLTSTVRKIEDRLRRMLPREDDYPFHDLLLEGGVSSHTVDIIADSFRKTGGAREADPRRAATDHLERHIKVAQAGSWSDVSGTHLFFGAGGCGKTSLIIKLAGRLVDQGKKVAVIALYPRHSGETERWRVVRKMLGIEAAAAYSLEEFRRLVEKFDYHTTVLVDTPCILTARKLLDDEFKYCLSGLECVNAHYIFDLNSAGRRLEREIDLYGRLGADFCVLTKLDITPNKARFLDLLTSELRPFSFINDHPDFEEGLHIATPDKLLSLIGASREGKIPAEEVSFKLNYQADLPENNNTGNSPGNESLSGGGDFQERESISI
ncbi:MAG: hypothetical protein JXB45_06035 [Candidatus Krumholzibacteriota bacterium]|nr:hypothetical protein [Candidatus Krumholzibacteriota bacterium]